MCHGVKRFDLILILNQIGKRLFDCDFKSLFWQMISFDCKSYFGRFLNTLQLTNPLAFYLRRQFIELMFYRMCNNQSPLQIFRPFSCCKTGFF
jgi:hypothetical protein